MFEKEAEGYASQGGLSKEKHFFGVKAIAFKDGAEYGYNEANKEMKDIIEKLLHKLIMASAPYKTDLTEEEIAEIRKFISEEGRGKLAYLQGVGSSLNPNMLI
jgi:hypothetical protein